MKKALSLLRSALGSGSGGGGGGAAAPSAARDDESKSRFCCSLLTTARRSAPIAAQYVLSSAALVRFASQPERLRSVLVSTSALMGEAESASSSLGTEPAVVDVLLFRYCDGDEARPLAELAEAAARAFPSSRLERIAASSSGDAVAADVSFHLMVLRDCNVGKRTVGSSLSPPAPSLSVQLHGFYRSLGKDSTKRSGVDVICCSLSPSAPPSRIEMKRRLVSHRTPVVVQHAALSGGPHAAAVASPLPLQLSERGIDATGLVRRWHAEDVLAEVLVRLHFAHRGVAKTEEAPAFAGSAAAESAGLVRQGDSGHLGCADAVARAAAMPAEAVGASSSVDSSAPPISAASSAGRYFPSGGYFDGLRICEIGAGQSGLAGIACASVARDAYVLVTDGHADAARRLAAQVLVQGPHIAQTNGSVLESDCLVWDARAASSRGLLAYGRTPASSAHVIDVREFRGAARSSARGDAGAASAEIAPVSGGALESVVKAYDHSFDLVIGADTLFFEDFHADQLYTLYKLLRRPAMLASMGPVSAIKSTREGGPMEHDDSFGAVLSAHEPSDSVPEAGFAPEGERGVSEGKTWPPLRGAAPQAWLVAPERGGSLSRFVAAARNFVLVKDDTVCEAAAVTSVSPQRPFSVAVYRCFDGVLDELQERARASGSGGADEDAGGASVDGGAGAAPSSLFNTDIHALVLVVLTVVC